MADLTKLMIGVGGAVMLATGGVALGMAFAGQGSRRRLPAPLPASPSLNVQHQRSRLLLLAPPYGRITIKESSAISHLLERLPPGPIGIAIHALGGYSTSVDHIARVLKAYPHPVTAYVPYRAMSGGTLVALAADEIVMNKFAVLGPVDPQLAGYPAHALADLAEKKPIKDIKEEWWVLGSISRLALDETTSLVKTLVKSPAAIARLTDGKTTHGLPISFQEATDIGLPIREGVPPEVTNAVDNAVAVASRQEVHLPF